jgi:hypothetical protein
MSRISHGGPSLPSAPHQTPRARSAERSNPNFTRARTVRAPSSGPPTNHSCQRLSTPRATIFVTPIHAIRGVLRQSWRATGGVSGSPQPHGIHVGSTRPPKHFPPLGRHAPPPPPPAPLGTVLKPASRAQPCGRPPYLLPPRRATSRGETVAHRLTVGRLRASSGIRSAPSSSTSPQRRLGAASLTYRRSSAMSAANFVCSLEGWRALCRNARKSG